MYFLPLTSGPYVQLLAKNDGQYTVNGVDITILRPNADKMFYGTKDVGTVAAHSTKLVPAEIIAPEPQKDGIDYYYILISESNGNLAENVWIRHGPLGWEHRYGVYRIDTRDIKAPMKNGIVGLIAKMDWVYDPPLP